MRAAPRASASPAAPSSRDLGRVPLELEVGAEPVGQVPVVLDDQDAGHGASAERRTVRASAGTTAGARQLDHEPRAAARRVLDPALAAVRRHQLPHHRQADPAAGHASRPAGAARTAPRSGAARSPGCPGPRPPPRSGRARRAARRASVIGPAAAVLDRVVEQVDHDLVQRLGVRRREQRLVQLGADPHRVRARQRREPLHDLPQQRRERRRRRAAPAPSAARRGSRCSTFSTRCASRRASCTMTATASRRSSSPPARPSSSVSPKSRIWVSGVRSSCDTLEVKSCRSRTSSCSRRNWSAATAVSPAVSASSRQAAAAAARPARPPPAGRPPRRQRTPAPRSSRDRRRDRRRRRSRACGRARAEQLAARGIGDRRGPPARRWARRPRPAPGAAGAAASDAGDRAARTPRDRSPPRTRRAARRARRSRCTAPP